MEISGHDDDGQHVKGTLLHLPEQLGKGNRRRNRDRVQESGEVRPCDYDAVLYVMFTMVPNQKPLDSEKPLTQRNTS